MSDMTVLMGYVLEAKQRYQSDPNYFRRANDAVLGQLPVEDAWPPLTRGMFHVAVDDSPHDAFRGNRVIHFAAYLNHAGDDLPDWLDKFENLLRNLYWMEAQVYLLECWCATPSRYEYSLDAEVFDNYRSATPVPPSAWKIKAQDLSWSEGKAGPFVQSVLASRRPESLSEPST